MWWINKNITANAKPWKVRVKFLKIIKQTLQTAGISFIGKNEIYI